MTAAQRPPSSRLTEATAAMQGVYNRQNTSSGAAAAGDCGHDHFHHLHPETDWMSCLEHAEKLGMGTREYELIKI